MTSTTIFAIHNRFLWIQAIVCIVFSSKPSQCQELDIASTLQEIRGGIQRLSEQESALARFEIDQDVYISAGAKAGTVNLKMTRSGMFFMMEAKKIRVIRNETEFFSVKHASRAGAWLLTHYHKSTNDATWKNMVGDTHLATYPLTALTNTWSINYVVDSKSFTPKRAKSISATRVEIDYEFTTTDAGSNTSSVSIEGTIVFAKDLDWLPVHSVTRTKNDVVGIITTMMDRKATREGDKIVVKTASFSCGEPGSQFYNKSVFNYKPTNFQVDPNEFQLSFYNIIAPEAADAFEDQPPFNWLLWGAIGVSCILASAVITLIVRRKVLCARKV